MGFRLIKLPSLIFEFQPLFKTAVSMKRITLPLFAFFLLLANFNVSAQIDTAALTARLSQPKNPLGKNVVFVLYKDGKVVYKKESGDFNLKTQQPINATSQWITAALIMTFVQEGKISLDDKVSDYLPIFTKYKKGYITIRHCLTHFTGIESESVTKMFSKGKYNNLAEEVDDFASKRDIMTNPGTEFKYSNVGLNIAVRVIEVITKRTFDRLLNERITRPLGMKATNFTNDDYNAALNPSGGARSTAADLSNFLAMILQKGKFNNKEILSEASVEMLHSLQASTIPVKNAPKIAEGWSYGFGEWIMEQTASGKAAVVSVPSLTGTWPVVDLCRGYAFILFTKELSTEPARSFYLSLKALIDESLSANNCK